MTFDYDDTMLRDCACGHTEHGPTRCYGSHLIYATPGGSQLPKDARPVATHATAKAAGLQAYSAPCECAAFDEYEGEQP